MILKQLKSLAMSLTVSLPKTLTKLLPKSLPMSLSLLLAACCSVSAYADRFDGKMEIKEVAEGVYVHISYAELEGVGLYPANGLVVVDGKDAYIIDTPWLKQDSINLHQWAKDSGLNIKASLSTHFHEDTASGIEYFNTVGVKTVASKLTNELLELKNAAKAVVGFKGKEFSLLDGKISVFYPGAGHSLDNVVVWLADKKVLFGGCLVKGAEAKSLGYTADGSIKDWPTSLDNVMNKFPTMKFVVPGHGLVGDSKLLLHTKKLIESVAPKKS